MSRKSKLTLSKEHLRKISECPYEIFNKIEPSDELFSSIERAEAGDVVFLMQLAEELYRIYSDEDELNPALMYFARRGLSFGSEKCAEMMIICMAQFNVGFEYLGDALAMLENTEKSEQLCRLIDCAKLKSILSNAVPGADYEELTDRLGEMYDEYSAFARIYLAHLRLSDTGSYEKAKVDSLAAALDIPSVVKLPSFTGNKDVDKDYEPENKKRECELMRFAISLIDMDGWRDFWLRILFEYSENYLESNLNSFGQEMLTAISERCNYARKKLHILALKSRHNEELGTYEDECKALVDECTFDGLTVDPSDPSLMSELLHEAIYLCSAEERRKKHEADKLGSIILHQKNRFILRATLKNHFKRASKHMWNLTLSIMTDEDTLPEFSVANIRDRLNSVSRGGVTLNHEKKLSQILCDAELRMHDRSYPFELDMILDISYVSSTKCEICEIKVKDYERQGDYLTMYCVASVY